VVVSGLARGIDGAAHRGALSAGSTPVLGIVGSGLDVIYPREHGDLWRDVAAHGVLLSEAPLGCRPEGHRFHQRNRLLAAAADAVVVVESAATGGSLGTAMHAREMERPLLVVPGGPWSAASAGTNELLRRGDTGTVMCLGLRDVLAALNDPPPAPPPLADERPEPAPVASTVLRALGWDTLAIELIAQRARLPVAVTRTLLSGLEADGWVRRSPAGWFQVAGPKPA
jgi:DNA processing protein